MKLLSRVLVALFSAATLAQGDPAPVTEEIPIGFLPTDWVIGALKKTLSPQGRYVFVNAGPVRITDQGSRIDDARRALEELQKAPAIAQLDLAFATFARRTVSHQLVEAPVGERGFPVPNRFSPPRILTNGRGGVVVVPSQPHDFRVRGLGAGVAVSPSTAESSSTETVVSAGIVRRFSASAVPGRATAVSVVGKVSDLAGLHALALKLGAIDEKEPAWSNAATEFLITLELSGSALTVNVLPELVVWAGKPGQPPRKIPLDACAAEILLARGALTQTGLLPQTDADFYRLFLGAPQAVDGTFTSMKLTGNVRYVGGPP